MTNKSNDNWLARAKTIHILWWVFSTVLAITVLAQLVFASKGYFIIDGWLGFGAVFGFLSCLVMVLVAKVLGTVLKREEHFYGDEGDDA